MRISLPGYKYCDALKIAIIDTLYDTREISHTNKNKLAMLLTPRSKCRKLRNNRTFDWRKTEKENSGKASQVM